MYTMAEHLQLFQDNWRGLHFLKNNSDKEFIQRSKARSFDQLYKECIVRKETELQSGKEFYEPSTYYGNFQEARYHRNVEWAARREATELFSMFSQYRGHVSKEIRPLPEDMEEYERKIWDINHPEPLTKPVRDLWNLINKEVVSEPWAWPIMIGLHETMYTPNNIKNTEDFPVKNLLDKFVGLGYTEKEFFDTHKILWKMFMWDRAKYL